MAIRTEEEANVKVREFMDSVGSKRQLSDPGYASELRKAIPLADLALIRELKAHLESFPSQTAGWGADDDHRVLVYDCDRQLQQAS